MCAKESPAYLAYLVDLFSILELILGGIVGIIETYELLFCNGKFEGYLVWQLSKPEEENPRNIK